jgi:predicted DNA-binding transcriptional regulator AlpA
MYKYSLALSATLDRPVPHHEAFPLGQRIARNNLLSAGFHENRFSVAGLIEDEDDWFAALETARAVFVEVLAEAGYTVQTWESVELRSPAETERRLSAAARPPMISTKQFAELCGISTQRIYELENERAKAAREGRPHTFPAPVVPGWWIKAGAQLYADTRKRKPGPAPRR